MNDRSADTAITGHAPQAVDDELAPGTIVDNFRIECTLGRGGMSTVYGAVHTVIGKRGAVKVLRKELCTDEQEVGRFVDEARAVNQIGHANIVDVFAFGTLPDGRSYLVMEWLVGHSLRNRMRRGPLSRNEVRGIVLDIVRALEATHAKQIIHRDLKPDNVFLVDLPGERPRAKLLDFGVAKLTGETRHGQTRAGSMLGTPQYLSPEQARGEAVLGSDIYALGVLLFELAAGRPPFVGDTAFDVVAMHMTEPPPKLSSLVGGVTPELDALVDAMLAKEPADRPTLARIRTELERLGAPPRQVPDSGKRSRGRIGLVVAALVGALAVVIAWFALRAARSEDPPAAPRAAPTPPPPPAKPAPRVAPPPPAPPAPPPVKPGTLVVEWHGARPLELAVDGTPAKANTAIELAPGAHRVEVIRGGRVESHEVMVVAGQAAKLTVRAKVRAPSPGLDPLDPLNNAPR